MSVEASPKPGGERTTEDPFARQDLVKEEPFPSRNEIADVALVMRLGLRIPDADDFLALYDYPASLMPLGEQAPHLAPVCFPLCVKQEVRARGRQFRVM